MPFPKPTRILRFIHVDNLEIYLGRQAIHAPNHAPDDGLTYRSNHNEAVQSKRRQFIIPCGPGGTIHDYVPFYFGPWSPMMLNLKTGRVPGYNEGQTPLIFLVSTAQAIEQAGLPFVFSDGHGLAVFSAWFDDLSALDQLDWKVIVAKYWADSMEDLDRKRRKQAEFLVYRSLAWDLIQSITVIDAGRKAQVEDMLARYPDAHHPPVNIKRDWYFS